MREFNINLHIQKLILNNFPHISVNALQTTVVEQLQNLLNRSPSLLNDRLQHCNMATIFLQTEPHISTVRLGQQIATQIFENIQCTYLEKNNRVGNPDGSSK